MRCEDKQAFRSLRSAAETAIAVLERCGPRRPYPCDQCTSYHLTSKEVTEEQVRELGEVLGLIDTNGGSHAGRRTALARPVR